MEHGEIIQRILDIKGSKIYLEIGTASGINFLKIRARKKFAVDPKNKILKRRWLMHFTNFFNAKFYEMQSDDFFAKHGGLFAENKIDVAFIDGLHTYAQSLKDALNCLAHLKEDGVIVMHDCNPPNEKMASPKPTGGSWNGDVWKTIVHLRTRKDLNVFVLDTDWGVGIVTKSMPENTLGFTKSEIEVMTYQDLEKNRREYLNLKPASYLSEFLG
jgi:hypothetical protein